MSLIKVNDIQTTTGTPNRGRVLQVVQITYSTKSTNASISAFTDTPFGTLTITPSATTSRILLRTTFGFSCAPQTTCLFRFTRNGTVVGGSGVDYNASFGWGGSSNDAWRVGANFEYLDSPASISALSYKVQFLPYDTGRTVFWNDAQGSGPDDATGVTTFTAMEIAG